MLDLRVETLWLNDGRRMQVVEPVEFRDEAGRVWRVPLGFVTDGASIPRELWSIIGSPFTGPYRIAAVLHDAAYATLGVAKLDADRMLREAALAMGCSRWLADALYAGVRAGGLGAYVEDQRGAGIAAQAVHG